MNYFSPFHFAFLSSRTGVLHTSISQKFYIYCSIHRVTQMQYNAHLTKLYKFQTWKVPQNFQAAVFETLHESNC